MSVVNPTGSECKILEAEEDSCGDGGEGKARCSSSGDSGIHGGAAVGAAVVSYVGS